MKRYPAWQAPFRCFYSMDFYRDVAANWGEIGFLYLFSMVASVSFLLAIVFQLTVTPACDRFFLPLAEQWPTITAEDGKFSIDKESPYRVKDTAGNTLVLFDMNGTSPPEGAVYVTANAIRLNVAEPSTGEPLDAKTWPFQGTCTTQMVVGFVKAVRDWGALTVFAISVLAGTIYRLFQALFYGAIGMIISAIMHANLRYTQLVRLAALSLTPMWLLEVALSLALANIMSSLVIKFLFNAAAFMVSMIYLGLAVNACKKLNQPTDPETAVVPPPAPPPATA